VGILRIAPGEIVERVLSGFEDAMIGDVVASPVISRAEVEILFKVGPLLQFAEDGSFYPKSHDPFRLPVMQLRPSANETVNSAPFKA
jgi:hypothetical protein